MPERKIVFLGGLHRSGTSLLFRILRDHPAVSGFHDTGVPEDEGQLLQTVYPPARDFGGPGKFGFDPRAFLDETSPLVTRENADNLFTEWSRYWDLGAEWLLEKSPPNLVRMPFLQAMFPAARFIMLLRHPVAVALATRKWSRTPVPSLVEHWVLCHERFAADRARVAHLHSLRYEDLVRSPESSMRDIYGFLDMAPAPLGQAVESDVNEKYFRRWRAARARRPGAVKALVDRFESRVRPFGYSLVDL